MTFLRGFLSPLPVVAVVAALLLGVPGLSAGVWTWPSAWVFLAVYGGVPMIGYGLLAVLRPESYRVRQQGLVAEAGKKQPLVDVVGLVIFMVWMAAWFGFIPLDVFRIRLLPPPPLVLQWVGLAAVAAGLVSPNSPSPKTATPPRPSTISPARGSG